MLTLLSYPRRADPSEKTGGNRSRRGSCTALAGVRGLRLLVLLPIFCAADAFGATKRLGIFDALGGTIQISVKRMECDHVVIKLRNLVKRKLEIVVPRGTSIEWYYGDHLRGRAVLLSDVIVSVGKRSEAEAEVEVVDACFECGCSAESEPAKLLPPEPAGDLTKLVNFLSEARNDGASSDWELTSLRSDAQTAAWMITGDWAVTSLRWWMDFASRRWEPDPINWQLEDLEIDSWIDDSIVKALDLLRRSGVSLAGKQNFNEKAAALGGLSSADQEVRRIALRLLGSEGREPLEVLLEAIQDSAEQIRIAAADQLGRLGNPEAVPALIKALGDRDEIVRSWAGRSLARLRDPRARDPLVKALEDPGFYVGYEAAIALGELGDSGAVPPLCLALKDADERIRTVAARSLGKLKDPRAFEALSAVLRDEHGLVRGSAVKALGEIGDPRALPFLADLLDDPDPRLVLAVLAALRSMKNHVPVEKLRPALRYPDPMVFAKTVELLEDLGGPRAADLLLGFLKQEPDIPNKTWVRQSRCRAVLALLRTGDPRRVPPAFEFIDGEAQSCWGLLEELGKVRDAPSLREGLKGLLNDAQEVWRLGKRLASIGPAVRSCSDPSVLDPLAAAVESPDPALRQRAVEILGLLGDRRAIPLFAAALRRCYEAECACIHQALEDALMASAKDCPSGTAPPFAGQWVRRAQQDAIAALGQSHNPAVVPLLAKALRSCDRELRLAAVAALGEIGDAKALELLAVTLEDADPEVRSATESILKHGPSTPLTPPGPQ